jgi:hypothetical protein
MRSRTLLVIGLVLLLLAGFLVAWAGFSKGKASVERTTVTLPSGTQTITKVKPKQSLLTTTIVRGGATRTITVPVSVPPLTQTIRLPGAERLVQVTGPTQTVPVRVTTTVVSAGRTVTETRTVTATQQATVRETTTVTHTATQTVASPAQTQTVRVTVPGPATTITVTETVKGNGNCPPKNPHCP